MEQFQNNETKQFKINKTIIIVAAVIVLVGVYIYYDFLRYQTVETQLGKMAGEIVNLKLATQPQLVSGLAAPGDIAKAAPSSIVISGKVKAVAGEIITLTGNILTMKDGKWTASGKETDYKIAVGSAIKRITYKGKEVKLTDIKVGAYLFVSGKADQFHPEEVVAETIDML